jgi:hypothetical protein
LLFSATADDDDAAAEAGVFSVTWSHGAGEDAEDGMVDAGTSSYVIP